MHFAPGKYEFASDYKSSLKLTYHRRLLALLSEYQGVVMCMLTAHLHIDSFRIYNSRQAHTGLYANGLPGWIQPSVSTFFKNPAFRVYKYSRDTSELLDYDQYFFNLTEANRNGFIDWKLEYRFSKAYGQHDGLNAKAMTNLYESIKTNPAAYDSFVGRMRVGLPINTTFCEPHCKQVFLSVIKCTDMDSFDECASGDSPA